MSFLLYAVALGFIPLVPSVGLLLIPMVIFGFAQSFYLPSAFSLLNETAPGEEEWGAFISLNCL